MKRISVAVFTLVLWPVLTVCAQDAATQERLDRMSGQIENLTEAQAALRKQISELSRELESLRDQLGKPSASYVRTEDLNRVAEAVKEVDRKRMEDAEMVRTELLKLRKVLEAPLSQPKKGAVTSPKQTPGATTSKTPEKGYEYVVQSGDTLDAIVLAYRDKNIKVTVAQILKANPGLKAERLKVGQKIFIPAPQ